MKQSDLRPAGSLAHQNGAKALIYGAPGCGKTPLINTAPRPVLCASEQGLLSMRGSTVPTWLADTPAKIEEFFKWADESSEVKNYDTIAIDSLSAIAEIILDDLLTGKSRNGNKVHGQVAYGTMAEKTIAYAKQLFSMPQKHICIISKMTFSDEEGGLKMARPYFPGKEVSKEIPHLFDLIGNMGMHAIPGVPTQQLAIRTRANPMIFARSRSQFLNEFEPPNLSDIFNKMMQR